MLMPMSSSALRASRLHQRVGEERKRRVHALAPQEHVVIDGQLVDQREVLEDRVDALGPGVVDAFRLVGLAVQEHAPAVLLLEAGDDLDQRRLARAVVAEQAEHLALAQRQVDVAQRRDRAEALGDVLDAQHLLAPRPGALAPAHRDRAAARASSAATSSAGSSCSPGGSALARGLLRQVRTPFARVGRRR